MLTQHVNNFSATINYRENPTRDAFIQQANNVPASGRCSTLSNYEYRTYSCPPGYRKMDASPFFWKYLMLVRAPGS
jgi:hypothetical protein